jgi:hypothetical protein
MDWEEGGKEKNDNRLTVSEHPILASFGGVLEHSQF